MVAKVSILFGITCMRTQYFMFINVKEAKTCTKIRICASFSAIFLHILRFMCAKTGAKKAHLGVKSSKMTVFPPEGKSFSSVVWLVFHVFLCIFATKTRIYFVSAIKQTRLFCIALDFS